MIRRILIATVVLLAMVVASSSLPASAQSAEVPDLTATLLLPADLTQIGLDDYGTGVGVTGGPDALIAFDRAHRGAGPDDRRFPTIDGLQQGAALYLLDRTASADPARVISSVVVYADSDTASAAFDEIVAARSDVSTAAAPTAADDSDSGTDPKATFVIEGVAPYDDASFRQSSVIALSGQALVEVAIERLTGSAAPVDDVLGLLPVILSRLADAGADPASPGTEVPELTGPDVLPGLSRYVVRDGELIPQYGQSDEDADAQAATFAGFETTDAYQFGYSITANGSVLGGFVSRHDSDDAARAYFRAIPDLLTSNDRYNDVRVGNAIVRAGDSATLVTYGIAGDDGVVVTEVIVLLGDSVAELIVNAPATISSTDMSTFAQALEACLIGGDCPPLTIPDDASFGTD